MHFNDDKRALTQMAFFQKLKKKKNKKRLIVVTCRHVCVTPKEMVVNIAYISPTDLQQLHSALHTTTTLSITASCLPAWPALYIRKFMGKVSQRMVYFLRSKPITRSTCILTRESCLALSTSTFDSCLFPLVKGGITSSAQCSPTLSAQVKPRSAIT